MFGDTYPYYNILVVLQVRDVWNGDTAFTTGFVIIGEIPCHYTTEANKITCAETWRPQEQALRGGCLLARY